MRLQKKITEAQQRAAGYRTIQQLATQIVTPIELTHANRITVWFVLRVVVALMIAGVFFMIVFHLVVVPLVILIYWR